MEHFLFSHRLSIDYPQIIHRLCPNTLKLNIFFQHRVTGGSLASPGGSSKEILRRSQLGALEKSMLLRHQRSGEVLKLTYYIRYIYHGTKIYTGTKIYHGTKLHILGSQISIQISSYTLYRICMERAIQERIYHPTKWGKFTSSSQTVELGG